MTRVPVLPLLLLVTPPCAAQEPPSFALTTDTTAYCAQLAHQIEARHSSSLDVQHLLVEGRRMCDHGEVMAGVKRLRRALVLLHHKAAVTQ